MEGKGRAVSPDPLHFRHWRQCHRVAGKEDHERAGYRPGLALGGVIYIAAYHLLAPDGAADQYTLWPVSFFSPLYKKAGNPVRAGKSGTGGKP